MCNWEGIPWRRGNRLTVELIHLGVPSANSSKIQSLSFFPPALSSPQTICQNVSGLIHIFGQVTQGPAKIPSIPTVSMPFRSWVLICIICKNNCESHLVLAVRLPLKRFWGILLKRVPDVCALVICVDLFFVGTNYQSR